jgi:biopolymer transport protein ExbB
MSIVFQFVRSGGFMMYPLILTSIILIAVGIERAISLKKAAVDGDSLLEDIKSVCKDDPQGNQDKGVSVCEQYGGCIGRMLARGMKNAHRPPEAIEMAMEQEAANEQPVLEANLPIIKTIVNISPLMGLLGTIAGMISAFRVASQMGLSSPTQILGGISEALTSTATGITLAVIGFILFNYYTNLTRKILEDMEYYGSELVNYITGRVD